MESANYKKFQTGNPVVRSLIDRFYDRLRSVVGPLEPASLLDAGCGEGETLARLGGSLPLRVAAVDIGAEAVDFTAERFPAVEVARHSIDDLPFADGSFDLVICLEVLEHLPNPAAAIDELARVASEHVVVSVPHEPWFRIGSLLRGSYVRSLGNHPEHVNHWNRRSLRALLEAQFEAVSLTGSFPWLIADCRVPHRASEGQSRRTSRSAPDRDASPPAPAGPEPASGRASRR